MREENLASSRGAARAGRAIICALLLSVTMGGAARAQGIERESLAGETAAQASLNSNLENQPYNFQIGPVNIRMDAGGSISYNDNINLAKNATQDDLIFAPHFGIHGLWQATSENALTLDLGISYQHYMQHSGNDAFLVSPQSQTQFNLFVGDFKINLHDLFAYQDDPVQVGQLSNTSQFYRFTNIAGVRVDWDLGELTLSMDYGHTNFWVFEKAYSYLNYQADAITPQISYDLSKTIQVGFNASFQDTRYDKNIQNDSTQIRGGPFVTAQISDYLSVNAQAGWVYGQYDTGGLNGDSSNINSYTCSAGVNHRINNFLSESLEAGVEFLPGITSNYTKRTYVQYSPSWQIISGVGLGTSVWYENLDDSSATFREESNRYGADLSLSYAPTQHTSISLSYQYVLKVSDVSLLNYQQNVVTLGFQYAF